MSDERSPDGLNPLPDIEATTDKIDTGLLTAFGVRHPQLTKTDLDFITAESTKTNFHTLQKIVLTDIEQDIPFHDKVMKVHDHLNRSGEEAQKLFPSITSPSQRTALHHLLNIYQHFAFICFAFRIFTII